jgi:hypothetical protein
MWIQYFALGLLAIFGSRPATRASDFDTFLHVDRRTALSWMGSIRQGSGLPTHRASDTSRPELGRALLKFAVKDLSGKLLDGVHVTLVTGEGSEFNTTTNGGVASFVAAWRQLPIEQTLTMRVRGLPDDIPSSVVVSMSPAHLCEFPEPWVWSEATRHDDVVAFGELALMLILPPKREPPGPPGTFFGSSGTSEPKWFFGGTSERETFFGGTMTMWETHRERQVEVRRLQRETTNCEQTFSVQIGEFQPPDYAGVPKLRGFVDEDDTPLPRARYEESPGSFHCDLSPGSTRTSTDVLVLLSWVEVPAIPGRGAELFSAPALKNALTITRGPPQADRAIRRRSGFLSLVLSPAYDLSPDETGPGVSEVVLEPFRDLQNSTDPIIRRLFAFPSGPVAPDHTTDDNGLSFGSSFIF